jgi:ribosomal protein L14E/L6E/L27E
METLIDFAERLKKDVPCPFYFHLRESGGIALTKYKSTNEKQMGLFAAVHDRSRTVDFKIVAKEWLADDWCKTVAKDRRSNLFGEDSNNPKYAGLRYYVKKDSIYQDYQDILRVLKIICNNPSF